MGSAAVVVRARDFRPISDRYLLQAGLPRSASIPDGSSLAKNMFRILFARSTVVSAFMDFQMLNNLQTSRRTIGTY